MEHDGKKGPRPWASKRPRRYREVVASRGLDGGDIHLVEGTIGATFRIAIPDRPVELLSIRNERARA